MAVRLWKHGTTAVSEENRRIPGVLSDLRDAGNLYPLRCWHGCLSIRNPHPGGRMDLFGYVLTIRVSIMPPDREAFD